MENETQTVSEEHTIVPQINELEQQTSDSAKSLATHVNAAKEQVALDAIQRESEIRENQGSLNVLRAKLAELQEAQVVNPKDAALAVEIRRLENMLYTQQVAGDTLEADAVRSRSVSMLDAIQSWFLERLKSESKLLFIETPKYFWKMHKDKQMIRRDQKRINELSGLTGEALQEKNRKDMKAMRRMTNDQLLARWKEQRRELSPLRSGTSPSHKTSQPTKTEVDLAA
jgi:hypothetical protein